MSEILGYLVLCMLVVVSVWLLMIMGKWWAKQLDDKNKED